MKRKILVLEDEENIRSFLVLNLKRSGYEVIEAETGEIALEKYHENQDIAVAVLDVMLPGIDGYEVCRAMRAEGYQAGVIMLTARTQEADKVNGLMNGADDYVTKPFSVIELAARVDALYRRVSGSPFSGGGRHQVRPVQAQFACARGTEERAQDRADADRVRSAQGVHAEHRQGAFAR